MRTANRCSVVAGMRKVEGFAARVSLDVLRRCRTHRGVAAQGFTDRLALRRAQVISEVPSWGLTATRRRTEVCEGGRPVAARTLWWATVPARTVER